MAEGNTALLIPGAFLSGGYGREKRPVSAAAVREKIMNGKSS
jgi:hypothetical protein